jgi:hypothetical protein
MNIVCSELVEDTCVKDSYLHAIHPQEEPEQHIPAIRHDSEPHLAHGVAAVVEVTFEEVDFPEVKNGVLRSQHLELDCSFLRI